MPIYSNNASCLTELFEALNDTDGFSQVGTNAKKYLLVFGVRKNVSILDFKALCIDINLKWLSLCSSAIEGDHIRIKLTKTACQILDKITVKVLSKYLRHTFNWRCVLDRVPGHSDRPPHCLPSQIPLYNRFGALSCMDDDEGSCDVIKETISLSTCTFNKCITSKYRRFRLGSWNVQGLNSTRKQLELSEILVKNSIDILAIQESWEFLNKSCFKVPGYLWFGKPRCKEPEISNLKRGESGVGFLIREGLQEVIKVIHDAEYKESIWLKLSLGGRDGSMYIGCIYLPIQGTCVNHVEECYEKLSVDISRFKSKGRVVLLGDFNARVGKGLDSDDVVGPFGEEVCNSNGTKLIELMQQSDLVLWNNREFCIEPQWTRIMPSLGQHSIVDYVASDRHLMSCSSFVHVDSTDVGSSDHLLLWVELGKVKKPRCDRKKRVIYQWRVDALRDKELREKYQEALKLEVDLFTEKLHNYKMTCTPGIDTVKMALIEWEKVVNRVARKIVGRKKIVCGRSVSWWDDELRGMVRERRACHKRVLEGNVDAWNEYCEKRRVLKSKIREKRKLLHDSYMKNINESYWNNRKFWRFVNSRQVSDNKKKIESLRDSNNKRVSNTNDKIHVLKEHYQKLGKEKNVESFENEWKIHVQSRIREFERLSVDITNEHLDRDISALEIEYVIKSLRNRKASGSDGIAGELIKYGGNGMIMMLKELFQLIWDSEYIPERWGEGMIISLFKKGDREDPGNYRGITLLNVVGKLFNKVLNYRLLQWLEEHNKLSESQAGFRFDRSCVDNIFILNEVIQGRLQEGKKTFCFFLDIKKAYDTVWRDGLWYKMWEMGIQGKLWRVIRNIYNVNSSCVFLNGCKSDYFDIYQGVAQGCTLSPTLFLIFIDGLMKEIERTVPSLPSLEFNGLLFADDFVGLSDSEQGLQALIDVIFTYSKKWRFEANVAKCAVVVFRNEKKLDGTWTWGDSVLPHLNYYTYLGVKFTCNGHWDAHLKDLVTSGKRKLNSLLRILCNPSLSLYLRRQVILSILRPSLEYGNEVWKCTSTQSKALDAVLLGACKKILSCSSKTCNEAVWGDLGVEPLALRRAKSKVVWYSKLLGKDENSYCRQVFDKEWGKCKLRGRRRKQWKKCVMDIISDMRLTVSSLDSKEALTNIDKVYMDYVTSNLHASMCEKNKLRVYRELKEVFECKKYLYGVPDMGSKLLFRFRSGTHGLNEELGRHITRNVSKACVFCNCDCESVEHVLWECPAYSNNRSVFINSLSKILCSDFHLMSAFEKTRYIFDQSVWECNGHFDHWFSNIKSFLCGIWNLRKEKLYPEDFSMNTASNSSIERRVVNGRNAMAKRS